MTHAVLITNRAERQMEEAFLWVYERNPLAAARWYSRLQRAIESLAEHPERHPLAPEGELLGVELRQMLFGKRRGIYRVLFTIAGEIVTIHHIRHGARRFLSPDEIADLSDE